MSINLEKQVCVQSSKAHWGMEEQQDDGISAHRWACLALEQDGAVRHTSAMHDVMAGQLVPHHCTVLPSKEKELSGCADMQVVCKHAATADVVSNVAALAQLGPIRKNPTQTFVACRRN